MADLFPQSGEPTAEVASARFNTGARDVAGGPGRLHRPGSVKLHTSKRGVLPPSGLVHVAGLVNRGELLGPIQNFLPAGGEQLGHDEQFGCREVRI